MARNCDPGARVLVFIDGQNAYKSCERLYKHGPTHPVLLADRLADGRKLVGVRYYSGVPDPTIDPDGRKKRDLRHNLMRRTGVTVVERQLRYRWEWGFDSRSLPKPDKNRGVPHQVTVVPYQRAREKGIDLAIGLDVVDLALNGHMDVAVIVSSDNDLCEAARAAHQATLANGNRVSVEAALFNESRHRVVSCRTTITRGSFGTQTSSLPATILTTACLFRGRQKRCSLRVASRSALISRTRPSSARRSPRASGR